MISSQRLGERLSRARKRAKLTQAQVADALGLARTTIVAIEKGERRPSNAELVKLAGVVGTKVNDLLREGALETDVSPRFRISGGARHRAQVGEAVEELRRLGERYVELERMHELTRRSMPLEMLHAYRVDEGVPTSDPRVDGEDAARAVRSMLGLGDEPVSQMDERFESEAGLRIFYLTHLPPKLAGLLIWTDEIGGCVGLNRAHPPPRQRWSLAHEFGHFLRDREAGDLLEVDTPLQRASEIFPEAFAKEFLLPSSGVQKRFAEKCRLGKFTPVDISNLARVFGVSFQAMTLRLEELRLLPRGTYDKIKHSGLRISELGGRAAAEPRRSAAASLGLPERYIALAISAYDNGQLSEREFANTLATDIATARAVYQARSSIAVDGDIEIPVDYSGDDLRTG